MASSSGHRHGVRAIAVALVSALVCAAAALLVTAPAGAARLATRAAALSGRPPEAVAYARIAFVHVLTYYNGTVSSDPRPIPVPSPCVADGALAGTTGTGLNDFNYVLVPTAAVNPLTPCQGAQAAFQQLNGNAASWSISHIDVLLNVAYTGTGVSERGSVAFSIDPAQIKTNGGATAPALLALALSPTAHAPTHDLPVLATPGPSDPPAAGTPVVLDLTGVDGTPLAHDALTSGEITTTLYPIALPAEQLGALPPQPSPTLAPSATASQQKVVGGTAVPSAPPQAPTAAATTPTPLSQQVTLGAPEVDSNGRLIGMVVPDVHGNHVLATLADVSRGLDAVTGKPGPLMTQWQQGLSAYYDTPPRFDAAAATFDTLASTHPDFGGAAPFADAARNHSTDIPPLTTSVQPVVVPATSTTSRSPLWLVATAALALLVVVIALLLMIMLGRSRRMAVAVARQPSLGPPEPELDLLPPNLSQEELDARLEMQTTMPLPAVGALPRHIDSEETLQLPVMARPLDRVRQGHVLMPHSAGLTDAGIKRAANPNQDNILAVQGIRVADGRPQPFGVFIVADGMGGHLHGQEASRLAIQIVTLHLLQTLETSQPLSESAVVDLLRDSVMAAGTELCRRNQEERGDMGTTMTAALTLDDMAYIANIGDSRTYLMSPETGLRQLTADHSVVASLVAHGVIRPEDIYSHPRRNQIYRSLGGDHEQTDVDIFEVPLQAGDKLLLCSDGLWEMVRDPQIEHILRGTADPRQVVELLVREANANGGEDNISAVVVRMLDDAPQEAEARLDVVVAPQASEAAGSQPAQT